MNAREALTAVGALRDAKIDSGSLARKQSQRLSQLVNHAYQRVPYYRKLFRRNRITPDDVTSPDDLRRIPLTSRSDIQNLPLEERIPEGVHASSLMGLATSGTTGSPLDIRVSRADAAVNQALMLRTLIHYGMKPWHKKMSITGSAETPRDDSSNGKLGLYRRGWISARWPPERWIRELRSFQPDYLLGSVFSLPLIAEALERQADASVKLRAILTTSGLLTGADREKIREGFSCPVFDVYGSWEGGMIAWECRFCRGYHVNSDWVLVEVLKDGRAAAPGEEGEVAITNLHSFGMPFIRYRQEDIAVVHEAAPPCSYPFPRLKEIHGRLADMITDLCGRTVSPHPVFHLVDRSGVGCVDRWQLVQRELNRFRLVVVPGPEFGPEYQDKVRRGLCELMGGKVHLDVVPVEELPREESRKFGAIVSEVRAPSSRAAKSAG